VVAKERRSGEASRDWLLPLRTLSKLKRGRRPIEKRLAVEKRPGTADDFEQAAIVPLHLLPQTG